MLQEKTEAAKDKWELAELAVIYENPEKAVYTAYSKLYQDVIIKMSTNGISLYHEYCVIQEFPAKYCCKAYAYDKEIQAFLEERIMPGTELCEISAVDKRLNEFAKIFRNIHSQPKGEYLSYLDWLEKAYDYCCLHKVESEITGYMLQAFDIGKELFEKYTERVLLHGDLHHHNILLASDGSYKIIDPKGVIGPSIFDIPRFILNEIGLESEKTDADHIKDVINKLAEILDYKKRDLEKLFFMEVILANVWCLESGEEIIEQEMKIGLEIGRKFD